VAATGNDGRGQVDYPARYSEVVAVSAIGLENSWPAGTFFGWTLSPHRGQAIGGHASFLAGFSNRGTKVALTAPGGAVLSTIFGGRWGVMSGTSMATPIATGVIARRLAEQPGAGPAARRGAGRGDREAGRRPRPGHRAGRPYARAGLGATIESWTATFSFVRMPATPRR
jgi:subtilisin family serine protease